MRQTLLVLIVILFGGGPLDAGKHEDPDAGFSFRYPDGWVVATRESESSLTPRLRRWIRGTDWSSIRLSLLKTTPENSNSTCNVEIVPTEMPIDEAARQNMLRILADRYEKSPNRIRDLRGTIRTFGMHETLVIDFDIVPSRLMLPPVHQRQVVFVGGGKSYIVTCADSAQEFPKTELEFDAILSSFHVPPRQSTGFDLSRIPRKTLGGIVGGLIGVVGYLIRRSLKKNEPAPTPAPTPDTAPAGGSPFETTP